MPLRRGVLFAVACSGWFGTRPTRTYGPVSRVLSSRDERTRDDVHLQELPVVGSRCRRDVRHDDRISAGVDILDFLIIDRQRGQRYGRPCPRLYRPYVVDARAVLEA